MAIILTMARHYDEAQRLVKCIRLPMMTVNTVDAALFKQIPLDQRAMFKNTIASSLQALKIAERTEGNLLRASIRKTAWRSPG